MPSHSPDVASLDRHPDDQREKFDDIDMNEYAESQLPSAHDQVGSFPASQSGAALGHDDRENRAPVPRAGLPRTPHPNRTATPMHQQTESSSIAAASQSSAVGVADADRQPPSPSPATATGQQQQQGVMMGANARGRRSQTGQRTDANVMSQQANAGPQDDHGMDKQGHAIQYADAEEMIGNQMVDQNNHHGDDQTGRRSVLGKRKHHEDGNDDEYHDEAPPINRQFQQEIENFDPTADVIPFDVIKLPNERWNELQKEQVQKIQAFAHSIISEAMLLSLQVSHAMYTANDETRRELVKAISTIEEEEHKHKTYVARFRKFAEMLEGGLQQLDF